MSRTLQPAWAAGGFQNHSDPAGQRPQARELLGLPTDHGALQPSFLRPLQGQNLKGILQLHQIARNDRQEKSHLLKRSFPKALFKNKRPTAAARGPWPDVSGLQRHAGLPGAAHLRASPRAAEEMRSAFLLSLSLKVRFKQRASCAWSLYRLSRMRRDIKPVLDVTESTR